MTSIRAKLLSGHLEASDFKITRHGIKDGKIMVDVMVPGVKYTRFHVDYFDEDRMIITYRYWGIFNRHTIHVALKKSNYLHHLIE